LFYPCLWGKPDVELFHIVFFKFELVVCNHALASKSSVIESINIFRFFAVLTFIVFSQIRFNQSCLLREENKDRAS
jgi:hypothetical protein